MKKILYTLLIFSTITISAQEKSFFENGEVQLKNPIEKINLRYENELPFVKVSIKGKIYNFLFDSGAPTVISHAIYNELKLKKKYKKSVKDSDDKTQQQIFTELPEMTVDQVVFKKVGAIVLDLNAAELSCLKVDGIIGANQMAKLFWRVNYAENSLETTADLSLFDLKDYNTVLPFEPQPQKTPIIKTRLFDKDIEFIFDTGFSGRFEVAETKFDPKKANRKIETFGTRSTGAFGIAKPVAGYICRIDSMTLGNRVFHNEIFTTSTSDRLGNEFFKDFAFIFDWKNNKIYMKRIINNAPKLESFGFSYRFIDTKPMVAFVFQQEKFPLKIGDSIISINNVNLDNLDQDSVCHYLTNRVEKDQKTIDIKIKRGEKILDFKLDKKNYLN
ncbi:putative aspartyl protease [Chryseobacterium ginsenosidimutans]|uniref:aspartyl protease family protein n=1 Tax=Chryseobacterium ginsenosidimutans TaxID=687846 RepID=UPI002785B4A0|nr:aspartyl protease family protein [Chryseobacterium ginsenosidimutans]MDQ0594481.1 putative aspartyl protease [Chryseobacterium ginsenosidimutans]